MVGCCRASGAQPAVSDHLHVQVGRKPLDRTSDDEVVSLLLHAQATRPPPQPVESGHGTARPDLQAQVSRRQARLCWLPCQARLAGWQATMMCRPCARRPT